MAAHGHTYQTQGKPSSGHSASNQARSNTMNQPAHMSTGLSATWWRCWQSMRETKCSKWTAGSTCTFCFCHPAQAPPHCYQKPCRKCTGHTHEQWPWRGLALFGRYSQSAKVYQHADLLKGARSSFKAEQISQACFLACFLSSLALGRRGTSQIFQSTVSYLRWH